MLTDCSGIVTITLLLTSVGIYCIVWSTADGTRCSHRISKAATPLQTTTTTVGQQLLLLSAHKFWGESRVLFAVRFLSALQ